MKHHLVYILYTGSMWEGMMQGHEFQDGRASLETILEAIAAYHLAPHITTLLCTLTPSSVSCDCCISSESTVLSSRTGSHADRAVPLEGSPFLTCRPVLHSPVCTLNIQLWSRLRGQVEKELHHKVTGQ